MLPKQDRKKLVKERENTRNIQRPLVTRLAKDTEVREDERNLINVLPNSTSRNELSRVP